MPAAKPERKPQIPVQKERDPAVRKKPPTQFDYSPDPIKGIKPPPKPKGK